MDGRASRGLTGGLQDGWLRVQGANDGDSRGREIDEDGLGEIEAVLHEAREARELAVVVFQAEHEPGGERTAEHDGEAACGRKGDLRDLREVDEVVRQAR